MQGALPQNQSVHIMPIFMTFVSFLQEKTLIGILDLLHFSQMRGDCQLMAWYTLDAP